MAFKFHATQDSTQLSIDPTVQTIPAHAFDGLRKLEVVELPEGLKVIGKFAFRNCKALRSFGGAARPFSSGLEEIQEEAFRGCESLASIAFQQRQQQLVLGERCFYACKSLGALTIPSFVKIIPQSAFAFCANLRSLDLTDASGLVEIQEMAFMNCSKIQKVKFPRSLQRIGPHAFALCAMLETVHFDSPKCNISHHCFSSCKGLKCVTLPVQLCSIEDGSFAGCTSLQEIEIPPNLSEIGIKAFFDCTSLIEIRIPSSVQWLGSGAFAFCKNMKSVHFLGECPALRRIDQQTFLGCDSLTYVRAPSGVNEIDETAISRSSPLASLEVPEGLDFYHSCIGNLKVRFLELPVHKLCFFQSYHHLQENLVELKNALKDDPTSISKKDALGKTPCHILSLSLAPQLALFQVILTGGNASDLLLKTKDNSGSTAMDCLCSNPTTESRAVLQALLYPAFANRLYWLGEGRWKTAMMEAVARPVGREPSSKLASVQMIESKLAMYERLESLTLLELALWKAKLAKNGRSLDRETCRIQSGVDAVLPNVLEFLDKSY
eukprot:scaffold5807_cov54-Cylindrotheca_fusiformis.AAC.2